MPKTVVELPVANKTIILLQKLKIYLCQCLSKYFCHEGFFETNKCPRNKTSFSRNVQYWPYLSVDVN